MYFLYFSGPMHSFAILHQSRHDCGISLFTFFLQCGHTVSTSSDHISISFPHLHLIVSGKGSLIFFDPGHPSKNPMPPSLTTPGPGSTLPGTGGGGTYHLISPFMPTVTSFSGILFPDNLSASLTICFNPKQHGTSM